MDEYGQPTHEDLRALINMTMDSQAFLGVYMKDIGNPVDDVARLVSEMSANARDREVPIVLFHAAILTLHCQYLRAVIPLVRAQLKGKDLKAVEDLIESTKPKEDDDES